MFLTRRPPGLWTLLSWWVGRVWHEGDMSYGIWFFFGHSYPWRMNHYLLLGTLHFYFFGRYISVVWQGARVCGTSMKYENWHNRKAMNDNWTIYPGKEKIYVLIDLIWFRWAINIQQKIILSPVFEWLGRLSSLARSPPRLLSPTPFSYVIWIGSPLTLGQEFLISIWSRDFERLSLDYECDMC